MLKAGLLPGSKQTVNPYQLPQSPSVSTRKTMNVQTRDSLSTNLNVVNLVPIAKGLSQKKDLSPIVVANCFNQRELKYVKDVFCVDQLSFVKHVTNVQPVASNLPIGARLQNCWKTWEYLGAGQKVVQILKEGYTLPFRIWPNSHSHKLLYQSPQEPLPVGGTTSAYRQKHSRIGKKSDI